MTNFAVLFYGNSDDSKTTRIVNHQGNHYVVLLLDSICFFFTESGSLHLKTIYTCTHINKIKHLAQLLSEFTMEIIY